MARRIFERFYGRRVEIDLCAPCQAFWFDDQELLQLTPGATLEVLAVIQKGEGAPRQPMGEASICPRCDLALVEVHDRQRDTRFSYHRCPDGHGRFLTYFQFLQAKNFVRALSAREIGELRKTIRQVHCSNCGAPVDVQAGARCAFCQSPLAILDPDQVRQAVAQLQTGERQRRAVDPALPLRLAAERRRAEWAWADIPGGQDWATLVREEGSDLVQIGLRGLARWLAG